MTFLLACLGGIAGLVVGWVATAAATIFIGGLIGVSSFEGAFAMSAIFAIGPIGGLAGLIAGVLIVIRKRRARAKQT